VYREGIFDTFADKQAIYRIFEPRPPDQKIYPERLEIENERQKRKWKKKLSIET